MIIATAGHIDHGKTALVRALTGTDADRLPEEKRRGITVDLGFAYHPLPGDGTLAFVDVPGHEKLVRTMLAGAVGVDYALLVVAADDGVMPQTREHLAILDLLGFRRGLVVLTKSDKVAPKRIGAVSASVRALLKATSLAEAPILPVSAHTGEGIAALRDALVEAAAATRREEDGKPFRFAVDRAFTLPGAGLVVTGTIHAGRVAPGDNLLLHAAGSEGSRALRVRDLHVANSRATGASAGQRCALNITGPRLDKSTVTRGDWIVATPEPAPSQRLDVRLRLLPGEARPLRHWTPVHVHLGCADIPGRIALLEGAALAPGGSALGQLVLDRATPAVFGDRFVLRDQSAQRTLGGGHVIEPQPPARGARRPERLARLRATDRPDDVDALEALLALGGDPVDSTGFAAARNLSPERLVALAAKLGAVTVPCAGRPMLLAAPAWVALREATAAALAAWLDGRPEAFGATAAEIARAEPFAHRFQAKATLVKATLVKAALDTLCDDGAVVRVGQLYRPPGHVVELTSAEDRRWQIVGAMLRDAGCDPPRLAAVAARLGETDEACRPLLEKIGRIGWLKRIGKNYFVLPDVLADLAGAAARCAESHPDALLTVGRFREETGISRHATMPVLEFFDRVGLTSRHADGRRLRMTACDFADAVGGTSTDEPLSNTGG